MFPVLNHHIEARCIKSSFSASYEMAGTKHLGDIMCSDLIPT